MIQIEMYKMIIACWSVPIGAVILIFWVLFRPIPNGRDVERIVSVTEQLKIRLKKKGVGRDFVWEVQPRQGGGVISITNPLDAPEIEVVKSEFKEIEPRNGIEIKYTPLKKQ